MILCNEKLLQLLVLPLICRVQCLIKLEGFEFAAADTTKTYANATINLPNSVNFVLKNCAGNFIPLRNSDYADFAVIGVPNGNRAITAIYTVFGSTKQLTIRDTSELKFNAARCSRGLGYTSTNRLIN